MDVTVNPFVSWNYLHISYERKRSLDIGTSQSICLVTGAANLVPPSPSLYLLSPLSNTSYPLPLPPPFYCFTLRPPPPPLLLGSAICYTPVLPLPSHLIILASSPLLVPLALHSSFLPFTPAARGVRIWVGLRVKWVFQPWQAQMAY